MSVYRKKVFPLRLPQNFHGQLNRQSLRQKYKERSYVTKQANPEATQQKIVEWQLKRTNNDIIRQRKQFLTHTGKISHDTPAWFQSTSDFYRKNQYNKLKSIESQQNAKSFDVFNQKRFSLSEWRMNSIDQKQETNGSSWTRRNSLMEQNSSWNVTGKVGHTREGGYSLIAYSGSNNRRDVTPKIGSVDLRNYSIKRPQLKVGKSDIIDTYSPF